MSVVVYLSGFVVINVVATVAFLHQQRGRARGELMAFAEAVPAPLTPQVEKWLAPQLRRRAVYPFQGFLWGTTAAYLLPASAWDDLPWQWFLLVMGMGVGSSAGALLASFRTEPLVDGPRRTADPVRRRSSDYYGRSHLLRLHLSVLIAGSALVLSATVVAATGTATAERALLACVIGLVLVAAHHWVVAAVVARPMVTSSAEGLLWQRAVVAKTVEPMPHMAFFAAIFTVVIAVYASIVDYRELSPAVLALSAAVTVLAVASVVAASLVIRDEKRRATPHPSPAP